MSVTLRPPATEPSDAIRRTVWSGWRLTAIITSAAALVGAIALATLAHPPTPSVEVGDTAGRIGFVVLLAAALGLVWWLDTGARRPVVPDADIFVPLRLIVGLFATLAATWTVYSNLVLDAFSRGRFGYLEWLTQMMNLVAARGMWNVWTPYPQGTQELLVALQSLAAMLAGVLNSDIWTGFTLFRLAFELAFLVGPAVAMVWLVGATGKTFGRSAQTIGTLTMALSFGIVYYGAASAYVTDPLPAALGIAAILAVVRKKFNWAGAAIGLGASLKLFPILLLPALVVLLPGRAVARVVGIAVAIMAVVFAPAFIANPEIFMSPLNWQSGRPAWESWYAFYNWVSGAPHLYPQPYFQDASVGSAYGWVFTGITPRVSVLQTPVPPGPLRWETVVSVIGTFVALLMCLSARANSPRSVVRWGLFCLTSFLVFGIGWSPQYELYLVPLIVLAFESPFVGAAVALSLQAVTFLEYPLLLPWAQFYGGSAVWLAWGAILARYILLGWLCIWLLRSEVSLAALRLRVGRLLGVARIIPVVVAAALPLTVHAAAQDQSSQACGSRRYVPVEPLTFSTQRDWQVPGGWFFTEASESPERGYTMLDDGEAMMWSEFNRLGGWQALGFAASRRFVWHGLLSQASQRAILQWSPITGQVDFANVLDLMHDAGGDMDLWRLKQIPLPIDLDEAGLPFETIAARRLAWLDSRPAIKDKYCNAPGGADPVQLWGLPTSGAVNVSDSGDEVYVLRTQRAAFQEWVGGADWAAPGQVTVVLAGDIAKEFNLLPTEATVPEPAPAR